MAGSRAGWRRRGPEGRRREVTRAGETGSERRTNKSAADAAPATGGKANKVGGISPLAGTDTGSRRRISPSRSSLCTPRIV